MKKSFFTYFTSLFLLFSVSKLHSALPEEYYDINSSEKSKEYFFSYFSKLINQENIKILEDRKFVDNLLSSDILNIDFNSYSFKRLIEIKKKYRIKKLYSKSEYLRKIDIVPPSMALAQAAVESGWGKSRFIKEANNIFGHWTYNPEIGMMPLSRDEDATHFIRVFKTLQDSISAYMLNLNRNRAYKEFQNVRFKQREKGNKPDGLKLSQTMMNYSGIGHNYLEILQNVITTNKLLEYDKNFYTKLNKGNK